MKNTGATVNRILMVEDEPAICEVCIRALTVEGFEVDIAANGAVGEDKLQEKHYDLVLIDIRTPVINGKELYHHISEKYPELVNRVILTTGEVIGSDIQSFLESAGRPFLPKPFTPDELRAIVRETLKLIEK